MPIRPNPSSTPCAAAFAECGFPPPEAERVRSLIGYSLPEIIRALLEMPSEAAVADIARTYSAHYLNPNNRNMTLFPDAPPCLDKLKAQGFRLAVATGKGRAGLDNAISQTATGAIGLPTACAGEYPSKPSPEMVFGLCGELGLDRKRHWLSAIRRTTCIWRQTQARRQSALHRRTFARTAPWRTASRRIGRFVRTARFFLHDIRLIGFRIRHAAKMPSEACSDGMRPLQKSPSFDIRNPNTGFRLFFAQIPPNLPEYPLNPPGYPIIRHPGRLLGGSGRT